MAVFRRASPRWDRTRTRLSSTASNKNCTLASGINIGTFNTNAAQLLALSYNIKFVTNYAGQTVGALGCTAYATAGLGSGSTVEQVRDAAIGLIDQTILGGTTTQTALGAMNLLLNCLNREA
jgi:hypothetical protein